MKIYSLYEFPKDESELDVIIRYVDEYQPVQLNKLMDLISETIVKANSRTNITLRTLKKIGLIEGDKLISLSSATQIYLDLNKTFQGLLLYLTYMRPELFRDCKAIYKLIKKDLLSNTDLIKVLWKMEYEDSKRTAQEKVYAIKRLISMCEKDNERNPFEEYEKYILFLSKLQDKYFLLTGDKKNEPIAIQRLKNAMVQEKITEKEFDENFTDLYSDPIYSAKTSFTTVIKEFANEKYYKILGKEFYYFKLSESIIKNDEG